MSLNNIFFVFSQINTLPYSLSGYLRVEAPHYFTISANEGERVVIAVYWASSANGKLSVSSVSGEEIVSSEVFNEHGLGLEFTVPYSGEYIGRLYSTAGWGAPGDYEVKSTHELQFPLYNSLSGYLSVGEPHYFTISANEGERVVIAVYWASSANGKLSVSSVSGEEIVSSEVFNEHGLGLEFTVPYSGEYIGRLYSTAGWGAPGDYEVKYAFLKILHAYTRPNYFLSVNSEHGETSGGGSYLEDSIVSFSVSPIVQTESDIRYLFTGWTSTSSGGYTGPDNSASVVMNGDVQQVAVWETEFYLSVSSEVGVEGEDWYAEGSTVDLNADSPRGFLIRKVFTEWSGDIESDSHSVTLMMDEPKTVVAEWSTDYSQAYMVGGLSAALIVGGGVVSVRRRRKVEKARAATELKKKILGLIKRSNNAVDIADLAGRFGVSNEDIKRIIDGLVNEGKVKGRYTSVEGKFITDDTIKNRLRQELESESLSYWVNIDLPTNSYKLHKETCRHCKPVETPLKGVQEIKRDGGWLKFDNKDNAGKHWKDGFHKLDWSSCKVCNP